LIFNPRAAYRSSAPMPSANSLALALRRPAFVALMLGCGISLLASARLSFGLAISTSLCWSFVPIAEIVALLLVGRNNRAGLLIPQVIDLFFAGHAHWLLWILAAALAFSFLPLTLAQTLFPFWLLGGGLVVLVWSLWIDYHFFRGPLGESRSGAIRKLGLQRLVSWTLIVAVYCYGSFWPSILGVLPR
jgi:hypothetical protein